MVSEVVIPNQEAEARARVCLAASIDDFSKIMSVCAELSLRLDSSMYDVNSHIIHSAAVHAIVNGKEKGARFLVLSQLDKLFMNERICFNMVEQNGIFLDESLVTCGSENYLKIAHLSLVELLEQFPIPSVNAELWSGHDIPRTVDFQTSDLQEISKDFEIEEERFLQVPPHKNLPTYFTCGLTCNGDFDLLLCERPDGFESLTIEKAKELDVNSRLKIIHSVARGLSAIHCQHLAHGSVALRSVVIHACSDVKLMSKHALQREDSQICERVSMEADVYSFALMTLQVQFDDDFAVVAPQFMEVINIITSSSKVRIRIFEILRLLSISLNMNRRVEKYGDACEEQGKLGDAETLPLLALPDFGTSVPPVALVALVGFVTFLPSLPSLPHARVRDFGTSLASLPLVRDFGTSLLVRLLLVLLHEFVMMAKKDEISDVKKTVFDSTEPDFFEESVVWNQRKHVGKNCTFIEWSPNLCALYRHLVSE
jgi:hypothetical protein